MINLEGQLSLNNKGQKIRQGKASKGKTSLVKQGHIRHNQLSKGKLTQGHGQSQLYHDNLCQNVANDFSSEAPVAENK